MSDPKMTMPMIRILGLFLEETGRALAGSDVYREAGVVAGTLYPALARLEKAGWLGSHWESIDPSAEGRPAKKLYTLTALGERSARAALEALPEPRRALVPSWA